MTTDIEDLELRKQALDRLAELDEELGLYPWYPHNPDAPGAPKEGAD